MLPDWPDRMAPYYLAVICHQVIDIDATGRITNDVHVNHETGHLERDGTNAVLYVEADITYPKKKDVDSVEQPMEPTNPTNNNANASVTDTDASNGKQLPPDKEVDEARQEAEAARQEAALAADDAAQHHAVNKAARIAREKEDNATFKEAAHIMAWNAMRVQVEHDMLVACDKKLAEHLTRAARSDLVAKFKIYG